MGYSKNLWNGSISFSMISLPVTMASAVDEGRIAFHNYAPDDSRIRTRYVSEASGLEVAYADQRKGYETEDGTVVFVTKEDLERAYGETSRNAGVLLFTDPDLIPPMAREGALIIEPTREKGRKKQYDRGAEKAYALLAEVLRLTGRVAIVEFGLRERKQLAVVTSREGYLYLEKLRWAEDIRTPAFAAPQADFKPEEIELGIRIVKSMAGKFDHASYIDTSRAELEAVIQQRLEGTQEAAELEPAEGQGGQAGMDLFAKLQASVEALKAA